ncbi:hypothetical protein DW66_0293 [Pseudomonas putida]|nr:hypothetical protein DW66_0293 [Pseudomonas putida]AJG16245.1 hypothetical protein RK21_04737 [Pseudomonas plecoglossicida]
MTYGKTRNYAGWIPLQVYTTAWLGAALQPIATQGRSYRGRL